MRPMWVCALAVLLVCLAPMIDAQKKRNEVSIGYMLNFNPWKLAVNLGTFERTTGFTIKWLEIQDSFKATVAMANNEVELVVANSADIARAFSRDLQARLVFVCEEIHDSEALLVHNKHHVMYGGNIRGVRDLIGKEVYVWYGSTAHYSLWSMLNEMQIDVEVDTTYMRGADCKLVPCHYTAKPNAVTLIGRNQQEIKALWEAEKIAACYVGLPELNLIKDKGTVLFTNSLTSRWHKPTFAGVLARNDFLDKTNPKYANYPIQNFMEQFVLELAKANFYYTNNTKEFGVKYVLDTIGTNRVSGAIASVTGGYDEVEVFQQLILRKYPSLKEQNSCNWLGCGVRSRVAQSLRDMSLFLMSIKEDWNTKGGLNTQLSQRDVKPELRSTSDIRAFALAEVKADYSTFVDTQFIQTILAAGQDGSYQLATGQYLHLGYEIMAMFGPTRSLLMS